MRGGLTTLPTPGAERTRTSAYPVHMVIEAIVQGKYSIILRVNFNFFYQLSLIIQKNLFNLLNFYNPEEFSVYDRIILVLS